jgi:hypothetical protein
MPSSLAPVSSVRCLAAGDFWAPRLLLAFYFAPPPPPLTSPFLSSPIARASKFLLVSLLLAPCHDHLGRKNNVSYSNEYEVELMRASVEYQEAIWV